MSLPSLPNLPHGLTDRTWVTLPHVDGISDIAGDLNTAHLRLPVGEEALAGGGGFVVSAIYGRPLNGPGNSTLVVRELATGAVVRLPRAGAWVIPDQVAVVPPTFYFAMRPDAANLTTGVYALYLPDCSVRTLIEPDLPRTALAVSPSGTTLASEGISEQEGAFVADVLGLPSGVRSRIHVQGEVRFVSDAQLFTTDNAELYAYRISTGNLDWSTPDITVDRGYVTSDGASLVLQTGIDPDLFGQPSGVSDAALRPRVVKIDTATGAPTTLVEGTSLSDAAYLWVQVSNDQAAVLIPSGHEPTFSFERGAGRIALTVVDLRSGAQWSNALEVSAPA